MEGFTEASLSGHANHWAPIQGSTIRYDKGHSADTWESLRSSWPIASLFVISYIPLLKNPTMPISDLL